MSDASHLDRPALDGALLRSFESLLRSLDLQPVGDDRFRVEGQPGQFDNTFGGQLVAQALVAATATVEDKVVSSFHCYFASAGDPVEPVDLSVRRTRDGRSMSTREVTLEQAGRVLLTAIASFHHDLGGQEIIGGTEPADDPTDLPLFQEWVAQTARGRGERASSWIERPPPVEMRIGEPPMFLGGTPAVTPRTHWMRSPRAPEDASLHPALLAHASDYLMLDMAFRAHPDYVPKRMFGTSLDHSLCFYRPVRFDRWHRHTMEVIALTGERGLIRGSMHDADGHLVASTTQEVLARVIDAPT